MRRKAGAVPACILESTHTMHITIRRLLLAATFAAAVPLGAAIAQTPAPAQPAAVAPAPATPQLTIRDVYDRVEAAGYRDQREIDFDHGRYEVKAVNAQGQRVKLHVNAATGAIEGVRVRR